MPRQTGSKNKKFTTFAFQSSDQRNYFVRTELLPETSYTVYSQPSAFKPNLTWHYLRVELPEVQNLEKTLA